jgi:hypothetical protein
MNTVHGATRNANRMPTGCVVLSKEQGRKKSVVLVAWTKT